MSDASASAGKDYAELRRRLNEAGCFRRNPVPTMIGFTVYLLMWIAGMSVFFLTENAVFILLNAVLLTFVYGRFGLLAHDFGHQQVFARQKWNNFFGHISAMVVGLNFSWWNDKHNAHHAHTNFEDGDPDIDLPILAYSERQAREKRGIARFIVKRQAWFFFPIQLLACVSLRISSLRFTLRERGRKDFPLNMFLLLLHTAVYLGIIFGTQRWWLAILFIIFHQKLWSAYITSIFAPNHKGMPVMEGQSVDFLREQILTARNIRPNFLINYYYGHLNMQIEHHLFPLMPRQNSGRARVIIKEFCREKNIEYYETSVLRSYIEIVQHMHRVSLYLR
jgi:fatty acid desaturase